MFYKNYVEHFKTIISFFSPLEVINFKMSDIEDYILDNYSHDGIVEITRDEYQKFIQGFMDSHEDLTLHDIMALEILDCKLFNYND